jgi:hypothetical protein
MEASKTTENKHFVLTVIFLTLFLGFGQLAYGVRKPSSANTTRTKEFTKPLYFDVLGGSNMPTPFVEYSLEEKGSRLNLGPVVIDEKTFSFGLRQLNEVDPTWKISNETYFFVKWPRYLFNEVTIELLTRDGNSIWKRNLTKADLLEWRKNVRQNLSNKKSPISQFNWALEFSNTNLPLEGLADGFRFCILPLKESSQERLCSQSYVVRQAGTQFLLGRLKAVVKPRILVNTEVAPEKGIAQGELGMPVRFFAELATGETLEFTSKPATIAWSDYTKLEGKDLFTVVGYENPPAGRYRILNPDRYSKWTRAVGFQSTISDSRKFWVTQVNSKDPYLYFQGESGGIFRHPLLTENVPSSSLRIHLDKRTPTGTYRNGVTLHGRKQASTILNSQEFRVYTKQNSEEFTWKFKAASDAAINRSSLLLTENGKIYRSYFELYKGYSNELSTRLSMILSQSGLILMGEAAYNLWFEDVLGWDQYYLTKQRWGVSTKYFQSITKYKVTGYGEAELSVLNADLKYRFTPGLWTRDESHGIMASYQDFKAQLTTTDFHVPMVGFGWFWARSMPQVFDEIFNYIPYMNYPKWVDMEFIYYAMSADSSQKLNFNFALNFHGQVLWKDNFFGEAGFGIKRYDFVDLKNKLQTGVGTGYQLNTLYGTVGLGLKF